MVESDVRSENEELCFMQQYASNMQAQMHMTGCHCSALHVLNITVEIRRFMLKRFPALHPK